MPFILYWSAGASLPDVCKHVTEPLPHVLVLLSTTVKELESGDDPNGGSRLFLVSSLWVIENATAPGRYFLDDITNEYGWGLGDRLGAFMYNKYQNELYAPYNDSMMILHPISCFGFLPSSGFVYLTKKYTGSQVFRASINITTPTTLTLVVSTMKPEVYNRYKDVVFDWAPGSRLSKTSEGPSGIYYDYRIRVGNDTLSGLERLFNWTLPRDDYQFFHNSSRQEIYTYYSGETVTLVAHKCKNLAWDKCVFENPE
ncbi:hypothetical protein FOL47_006725 [Perkinsus chesapeaki]|uniref:Uncharacterized protein n=1 Tax=Perkinsus chesapeaki TaxID=330153 RepID=A0A7J6MXQ4_PERCH|nr:hypothetical protein FOL47_006725 [Perkinsus chesapeaki]